MQRSDFMEFDLLSGQLLALAIDGGHTHTHTHTRTHTRRMKPMAGEFLQILARRSHKRSNTKHNSSRTQLRIPGRVLVGSRSQHTRLTVDYIRSRTWPVD